ncbi:response regulator transcription factor [Tenacibaculum agarivorans]|uniref:response regulator transcription factor n=1 Tax=Tenacibaculum agarivorans TaxID=1908389 RepID=UPI00094B899C|nr:response regulator transcription factor [Tenacibaculum agarivorans]
MIKISIVDDEALFLEGINLLFSIVENIRVVSSTTSAMEMIDKLSNISKVNFPDIILVDILMKPVDGFELVERLKKKYPDLKIIILSSHYKQNVLGHMFKLGISAFIPKNANKELLVNTIESVYKTGVCFTKKDHEMLIEFMNSKIKKPTLTNTEELSEREKEVLKLICLGHTNKKIADKLFLSKRTIESHRQRIMQKTGVKNTVGLVIYAIANHIYKLPIHYYTV